jgi:hypothetical protein
MPSRRFPCRVTRPPWSTELTPNCFIVRDADGQALSYIYYESEPGRRSTAKLLSRVFPATPWKEHSSRLHNAIRPSGSRPIRDKRAHVGVRQAAGATQTLASERWAQ